MVFGKVDIDELSSKYKTVPTLVVIKNGKIVDHLVGLPNEDEVISFINKPID